MSEGQSASEEQKGQSDMGTRVSTKKFSVGFRGGAMNPSMTTVCPASSFSLLDRTIPSDDTLPYISLKRRVSAAGDSRGHAPEMNRARAQRAPALFSPPRRGVENPVTALPFDRPIHVEGRLELGTRVDVETGFVSLVRIYATRLREAVR
jgi:hypothetical protein